MHLRPCSLCAKAHRRWLAAFPRTSRVRHAERRARASAWDALESRVYLRWKTCLSTERSISNWRASFKRAESARAKRRTSARGAALASARLRPWPPSAGGGSLTASAHGVPELNHGSADMSCEARALAESGSPGRASASARRAHRLCAWIARAESRRGGQDTRSDVPPRLARDGLPAASVSKARRTAAPGTAATLQRCQLGRARDSGGIQRESRCTLSCAPPFQGTAGDSVACTLPHAHCVRPVSMHAHAASRHRHTGTSLYVSVQNGGSFVGVTPCLRGFSSVGFVLHKMKHDKIQVVSGKTEVKKMGEKRSKI